MDKVRQSNFELIRILAQFFIVFYHIFGFFIYPSTHNPLHRAIWLPLHIGVILFILISGYFGIKASIRGFVKLVGMMAVLYIPLALANYLIMRGGGKNELSSIFLLISAQPFWYMRTYVFLYLFAPFINMILQSASKKQLIYLILVLGFISHYVGTIGFDPSLTDGKNLITFLFLYSIGYALHKYEHIWKKIRGYWYGIAYIAVNAILVFVFSMGSNRILDLLYSRVFFAYCSFGLLVSSILFFLWIGSMDFRSRFVNYVAKSSLAIYMIHGSNLLFFGCIGPVAVSILNHSSSQAELFCGIFLLTIVIVSGCVAIDKLLSPVWKAISALGKVIESKSNIVIARWLGPS